MSRKFIHKQLAAGGWSKLSLVEQLANIGSEVSRVYKWQEKDKDIFWSAVERALELFDLTLKDPRWKERLKEIARVREVFCDAVLGGKEYNSSFKDLDQYFFDYAFAARSHI